MKTIIFSDTHIGFLFNKKKFNYIKNLILSADRIIINGDFWDDEVPLAKFLSSKWIDLFKLLKEKEAIYVYGNHDKKVKDNSTIKQYFKEITDKYELEINDTKYIITHGNLINPTLTEKLLEKNLKNPIWKIQKKLRDSIYTAFYKSSVERIPVYLFKENFYKIFNFQNKKMKKYAKKNLKENHFLICGHSHLAEIDTENNFANSGCINYGLAQHIEITNNEIKLIKNRY